MYAYGALQHLALSVGITQHVLFLCMRVDVKNDVITVIVHYSHSAASRIHLEIVTKKLSSEKSLSS